MCQIRVVLRHETSTIKSHPPTHLLSESAKFLKWDLQAAQRRPRTRRQLVRIRSSLTMTTQQRLPVRAQVEKALVDHLQLVLGLAPQP